MKKKMIDIRNEKIIAFALVAVLLLIGTVGLASATGRSVTYGGSGGLVAYYPFNGNAHDESGNGNDGTVDDATWVDSGGCVKALSFDGNDYVDCGKNPSITDDATIEAWVNFAAAPAGHWTAFVSKDEGSGVNNKWVFGYMNGKTVFHVGDASADDFHVYSNEWTPILNQWYHLAVVKSGDTYTFYRDGAADGTDSATLAIPTINAHLEIGRAEGGGYFNGIMDEVRIYNYALSQSQIPEDMRKCTPSTPTATGTPTISPTARPTPATAPATIDWASISQGASTVEGEDWGIDAAVDDSRDATWDTGFTWCNAEPTATITIDLGQVREDLVQINTYLWDIYDDRYYYGYKIELSKDNINWVTVADKLDTSVSSQQSDTFTPSNARYIRYTGQRNSKNIAFHIIEVEAYSALTPQTTPTPAVTLRPTPTPAPIITKLKKCEGDEPYLYVGDRVMEKGKTIEIPIIMCNAKDLANMDLDRSYDASVLKLIDVTKGSLNKNAYFEWNKVSPGKLKIAFASSKGVSGSGSIAVMKFEVIGNTGAKSTITGTVDTAGKTDGSTVSVGVNPGEVTVGTSPIKGDCDGDNKLTSKDAVAALLMSVEKMEEDLCYDYNGDGKVNSDDARDILKAIVTGGK